MDGTSTMSLGLKVERSLTEVAAIMGLSRSRVEEIEKQAFHKIRQDPELCELWADYLADVVEAQAEPSGYKRLIVWWD
jgi:transcriptional regulator